MASLPTISENPEELRQRSLSTISILSMVGSWLLLPAYLISAYQTGNTGYYALVGIGIVFSILLTIALVLQHLGYRTAASWILTLSIGPVVLAANFVLASLGLILAIAGLIVALNVAWQTMTTKHARIASIFVIVFGIAGYLVDILLPQTGRILATSIVQQAFIVLGGIVIIIFSINLLRHFSFSSIRAQITLAFFVVAFIPIMIVFIPQLMNYAQNEQLQAQRNIEKTSIDTAQYMDDKLENLVDDLETNTQLPGIRDFLTSQTNLILLTDTLKAVSKHDNYVLSYGVVNYDGVTVADIRAYRVGSSEQNDIWFQQALSKRSSYISDVIYDALFSRPVFYISTPVFNETEEISAVLRVEYDATLLFDLLAEYERNISENTSFMLIDSNSIILAHTKRTDLQFKTIALIKSEQLAVLQQAGLLPAGSATEHFSGMSGLGNMIGQSVETPIFRAQIFPNDQQQSLVAIKTLRNKPWRVALYQPEADGFQNAFSSNIPSLIIFAIVSLAIFFAANQTGNLLTQPLNNLSIIAKEIGTGNLTINIHTSRKDEIGMLANIFDDTVSQLRNIMENLENRVAQRTSELVDANKKITKRAEELKTIANLAQLVTSLPSLEILLPQVTEKISESFGCYHVGIFLMDISGEYAMLSATNSVGGRKMLERGYKIRSGQIGVIGYTANSGQPRIALDVGEDATFFNNPDLPLTRSELTLPLFNGNKVIGVMDLQSDQPAAFVKDDIEILTLLTEQLSLGIQNARAFEETSKALHEAQTLYQKAVSTSWREIISQETTIFHYGRGSVEQIRPGQELPQTNMQISLHLPIIVRGQALGQMEIRTPKPLNLSEQELRIYKSIIDRLAFTLENARLFRDAQKLATKERIIGEISSKLGATSNLDNILETAAKEIGQVIPDTEVVIQLTPSQDTK